MAANNELIYKKLVIKCFMLWERSVGMLSTHYSRYDDLSSLEKMWLVDGTIQKVFTSLMINYVQSTAEKFVEFVRKSFRNFNISTYGISEEDEIPYKENEY